MMDKAKIIVENPEAFFQTALKMARTLDQGDCFPSPASISFPGMGRFLRIAAPDRWPQLLARGCQGDHADVAAPPGTGLSEQQADAKIRLPWKKIFAETDVELAA